MRIFVITLLFGFLLSGCIEELDVDAAIDQEGVGLLVVEASLTTEMKRQEVFLSRTDTLFDLQTDTIYNPFIPLGQGPRDSVNHEQNAIVQVTGSDGSTVDFTEDENGTYLSSEPFALQSRLDYVLQVTTSGGTEYISGPVRIQGASRITDVYAERALSDTGVDGIQIFVNSETIEDAPANFRYTYEETYKIIAPNWVPNDFKLTNYDPCALPVPTYDLEIIPREEQNRVCYNTVSSNTIIQAAFDGNERSQINRFPVRFIGSDNFVISHRYSIMIRQHVQSLDAYLFYETIKNFSETESLLSQIQPGVLKANVFRRDGDEESVLGYVEATQVSEQRLFFDYEDFFPDEALPPYPFNCFEQSAPESHASYCASGLSGSRCPQSIIERINLGLINYTGNNDGDIGSCPGPYTFVSRICGDCTLLGENTAPDFWEE